MGDRAKVPRVLVLVCDSFGVGDAPDADAYDDAGSDTLGNTAAAVGGIDAPNLGALGLGLVHALSLAKVNDPAARAGVIQRASVKRLRGLAIAPAAEGGVAAASVTAPAKGPEFDPFPERVRAYARLSKTGDPAYPFRVILRLRNQEEVERLARFVARLVPLA